MSELQVTTVETANGSVNLTLKTGNTIGPTIVVSTNGEITISGNGLTVPVGNSSTRPVSGANGIIRYNTDSNQFEGFADGEWGGLGTSQTKGSKSFMRFNYTELYEDVVVSDNKKTFTANSTNNTLSVGTDDGYKDNDIVMVTSSNTLPNGLTGNTSYYVINAAASTMKVSATYGGSEVGLLDAGNGTHQVYRPINAFTTGPIEIGSGHSVEIDDGSTWTVV
jgi:hypothetical protein